MAGLTGCGEAGLGVGRIVGLIEVRHVAAHASRGRTHKLPAGVTGVTVEGSVRSDQGESRELQVIELSAHPVVHGVALFASDREIQRDVVDSCGPGVDEIFLVAGVALRRKTLELADSSAFVTRITINHGVRAHQREPVQVLVDLLDRDIPAFHRVALFAVSAHLGLVNVRMALAALRSDIRENGLGMTLRTGDACVHPAQWIFGGVVIELGYCANRLPATNGVAVLTRNAQASVRAARAGRGLSLLGRGVCAGQHRKNNRQMKEKS